MSRADRRAVERRRANEEDVSQGPGTTRHGTHGQPPAQQGSSDPASSLDAGSNTEGKGPQPNQTNTLGGGAGVGSQSAESSLVEDTPVPKWAMPCFNCFFGSLLAPEDDFVQTCRKIGVVVQAICSMFALLYGSYWTYLGLSGGGSEGSAGAGTLVEGVMAIVIMFIMFGNWFLVRRLRHVSDLHITVFMWILFFPCAGCTFGIPQFGTRILMMWYSILVVISQSNHLLAQAGCSLLVQLVSCYNDAWGLEDHFFPLLIPGARFAGPGWEVFIELIGSVFVSSTVVIGVMLQARAHVKMMAEAQNSVRTAQKIVTRLRKYDTDGVQQILEDVSAGTLGAVNLDLMESFQQMNDNLEKYRPFLPNYLFLEEDEDNLDLDSELGAESANGTFALNTINKTAASQSADNNNPSLPDSKNESALSSIDSDGFASSGSSKNTLQGSARARALAAVLGASSDQDDFNPFSLKEMSEKELGGSGGIRCGIGRNKSSKTARRSIVAAAASDPLLLPVVTLKQLAFYKGLISFALVDICTARLMQQHRGPDHSDTSATSADVLHLLVEIIYKLAKETKASVHSMLGDTVQLTWNATNSVPLPETKGATFLTRLLHWSSPAKSRPTPSATNNQISQNKNINHTPTAGGGAHHHDHDDGGLHSSTAAFPVIITGAICSGPATVHNIMSHFQQTLVIEAPWLPCLEGCLDLAKQHNSQKQHRRAAEEDFPLGSLESKSSNHGTHEGPLGVVLMDERTMKASQMEVESCAVERMRFVPLAHLCTQVPRSLPLSAPAAGPKCTFLCHYPRTPIPPGGIATNSAPVNSLPSPGHGSIAADSAIGVTVYQLLKERVKTDDEWMYQLQLQDQEKTASLSPVAYQARAITAASEGRVEDALLALKKVQDLSSAPTMNNGTAGDGVVCSSFFTAALVEWCQTTLRGEGGGKCESQNLDSCLQQGTPRSLEGTGTGSARAGDSASAGDSAAEGTGRDTAVGGDAKAIAKRRKMLGKQLNAWKAQFAEDNGKEPTSKDIKRSEEIAPVYKEYKALQKAKHSAPDAIEESGNQDAGDAGGGGAFGGTNTQPAENLQGVDDGNLGITVNNLPP